MGKNQEQKRLFEKAWRLKDYGKASDLANELANSLCKGNSTKEKVLEGIQYFLKEKECYEFLGDPSNVARVLSKIAATYVDIYDYEEANKSLKECIALAEKNDDIINKERAYKTQSYIVFNKFTTPSKSRMILKKCIKANLKCCELYSRIKLSPGLEDEEFNEMKGIAYENLSYFYLLSEDLKTSLDYFNRAERTFGSFNDDLFRLYTKTADFLISLDDFPSHHPRQRKICDLALKIWRKKDCNFVHATIIKAKGFILTRNFLDAEICLRDAYDENSKDVNLVVYLKAVIAIQKRTFSILKGDQDRHKLYEDIADIIPNFVMRNFLNEELAAQPWEVKNFNLLSISYYKKSIEELNGKDGVNLQLAKLYFSIAECYKETYVEMYEEALDNYNKAAKLEEGNPKEQAKTMEAILKCMISQGAESEKIMNKYHKYLEISRLASTKQYELALNLEEYLQLLKSRSLSDEIKNVRSKLDELNARKSLLGEEGSSDEESEPIEESQDFLGDVEIETVDRKWKRGVSHTVDKYNQYPLNILVKEQGKEKEIKMHIQLGDPLERRDGTGWTPLGDAMETGILSIIKILVEAGANLNTRQPEGDTPLILASRNGWLEVIEYLLSEGADPTPKNNKGETALAFIRSHLKEQTEDKKFENVQTLKTIKRNMESKFRALCKEVDTKLANISNIQDEDDTFYPSAGKNKEVKLLNKHQGFNYLQEEKEKKQERKAKYGVQDDASDKPRYGGQVVLASQSGSTKHKSQTQMRSNSSFQSNSSLLRKSLDKANRFSSFDAGKKSSSLSDFKQSTSFTSLTQKSSLSNPSTPSYSRLTVQSSNSRQSTTPQPSSTRQSTTPQPTSSRQFIPSFKSGQSTQPINSRQSIQSSNNRPCTQSSNTRRLSLETPHSCKPLPTLVNRGHLQQRRPLTPSNRSESKKGEPEAVPLADRAFKQQKLAFKNKSSSSSGQQAFSFSRNKVSRYQDETMTFEPNPMASSTQIINDADLGGESSPPPDFPEWLSEDEELPDIAENIPHQTSGSKRSRRSSSRSSRGSAASFLSLSRSPSPSSKPSAALPPPPSGAQLYREVIQGIKEFRPQGEVKELSPSKDDSPPESTEILTEEDWLVDDLAELRAEKAEKKRKRHQSPSARYSSPSPERYSSSSNKNDSPPRSSRVSKLSKKRRSNKSIDETESTITTSTVSITPKPYIEDRMVTSDVVTSTTTPRCSSPIFNDTSINVDRILMDSTFNEHPVKDIAKKPVGKIKVKVENRTLIIPVQEHFTVDDFAKEVSVRYNQIAGSKPELALSTDDGAELYKNDRLLDLVTFTDTLVATPLSWAIQDPHVKFEEICKEQNLDPPKNVMKPLERIADKEALVINQPLKQETFSNIFRSIEGYVPLQVLDLKYCKLGKDSKPYYLHQVLSGLVNLHTLDLSNNHLTTSTLDIISPLPPNLTTLVLSDNQLQSVNLKIVGKVLLTCSGLVKLVLSNTGLNKAMLRNSQDCTDFQKAVSGLSEFDVSNNNEMEASGLESLLKLCSKKLEKLDISNFTKETEADSLRGLVNFCKMDKLGIDLEQLSIRDCKLSEANLTDLDKILFRLPKLKKLDLSGNNGITGSLVAKLFHNLCDYEVQLSRLELLNCQQIFSSGLEDFVKGFKEIMSSEQKLRYLAIPVCDESKLNKLKIIWEESWKNLTHVQMLDDEENVVFKIKDE